MSVDEELSVWPSAGQVEPDVAYRGDDPCSNLEELHSERGCLSSSQRCGGKPVAEEIHEVVGQGMKLKTEGVGAIPAAAQAVGVEIVLQFVYPVFGLTSTVVDGKELVCSSPSVGDHTADVCSLSVHFHLDEDPSPMGPGAGSVEEAGEQSHGGLCACESVLCAFEGASCVTSEGFVVRDSRQILDAFRFEKVVETGRCEACVCSKADRCLREARTQAGQYPHELWDESFRISGCSPAQPGGKQMSRVALEDEQGMVHVSVVLAVKQRQLLMTVGGIVRRVCVQEDLLSRPQAQFGSVTHKPLKGKLPHAADVGPTDRVLQTRESRLSGQRFPRSLRMNYSLESGIESQEIGIDGVLVARGDLIYPLLKKSTYVMQNIAAIPGVVEQRVQRLGQSQPVIQLPENQKPGVCGHGAAPEIHRNFGLKPEGQLCTTVCSHRSSLGCARVCCSNPLIPHLLRTMASFFH